MLLFLPPRLRQDATVIGLVSVAHCISHFSQLLLAPLFPWLKEALDASYAELGFLMTIFFVSLRSQRPTSIVVCDWPVVIDLAGHSLAHLAARSTPTHARRH